jgi:hypothetical protein
MAPATCPAQEADELDPVMLRQLKKLEETWHVLDIVAGKVWPGWDAYADVPYLFEFQNNVKLVVGFPDPPQGFELVHGVKVRGRTVHIDRRNEVAVELRPPTNYGGGLSSLGSASNETVAIVSIDVRMHPPLKKDAPADKILDRANENQILLNVHELFHALQDKLYEDEYDNLRYVPDANYAIYSEIEGIALKWAFFEEDAGKALEYLKDFVIARKIKYRSMAEIEQLQEKAEDINEGTARYSEYVALQIMSEGFQPAADDKDLPYYFGFRDIDYFIGKRWERFDGMAQNTFYPKMKCYDYGCCQALLLDRFVPGWKETIFADSKFMYDIIVDFVAIEEEEESRIASRLAERYDYDSVAERQSGAVNARDEAFKMFNSQKGRVYIINLKHTHEYASCSPMEGGEEYIMGFRRLYPKGIKPMIFQEVSVKSTGKPILVDQIYYMRYVDTENADYEIQFSRVEGDVYHDAVVSTNGFTLAAPKIRVKERDDRVKFIILAKVSEQ